MNYIWSIRLRLWLPLLVLLLFTLLLLFMMTYERNAQERKLHSDSLALVHRDMADLQRELEEDLEKPSLKHVKRVLSALAVAAEIRSLAVIDQDGRVLLANHYAWEDRRAVEIIPELDSELLARVQRDRKSKVFITPDADSIQAYYPLTLASLPGELRSSRTGALFMDYDLSRDRQLIWHQIWTKNLTLWLLCLLLMGLMIGLLHLLVSQPLKQLSALALRVAGGEHGLQIGVSGEGELASLARAFNTMNLEVDKAIGALRDSEQYLTTTLSSIGDAVIATDDQGRINHMNRIAEQLTGWKEREAAGRPLTEVFQIVNARTDETAEDPVARVLREGQIVGLANDTALIARDGSRRQIADSAAPIRAGDGEIQGVVLVFRDVTEEYRLHQEIEKLAYYDALTSLPNRRLLLNRLDEELASARRHALPGALLFLDLDHFKTINDALGHSVGDALLKQVAKRMRAHLRQEDMVSRLAGDEFVILLRELGSDPQEVAVQARTVAEKLQQEFSVPFRIEGHEYHITSSIGIALFPADHEDAEEILKQSDTAMYRAKAGGRNSIRFYQPSMQAAADARLALEKDLRRALSDGGLCLFYQPQIDAGNQVIGAEALLRWKHPERGLVPPGEFIPVAEETGLILPLGRWVFQTAFAQLKRWTDAGTDNDFRHLAVNVSARQFRMADFVAQVRQFIDNSGIDPGYLTLELTESSVIHNIDDTIDKMQSLKAIGVRFSIDDFGTGYSSLAYLKRLPLDQLKIDRSFVGDICVDGNDETIVEAIISMANLLKLEVIAEGVEKEEHLRFLRDRGCLAYQGFYFARPMPEPEFTKRFMS